MATDVKILSSRRAYEFGPDDIRLTVLSAQAIAAGIQQLFGFQSAQIGTPPPTFGSVPITVPPGLVFQMGVMTLENNSFIVIRYLHFEQRRIVIDVAGPSDDIDPIYTQLQSVLGAMRAADGTAVIGSPARTLDYSEASTHFSFAPEAVLPSALRDLFGRTLPLESAGRDHDLTLIPLIEVRVRSRDSEYAGANTEPQAFHLELRAGSTADDKIYYSAAPLSSNAHIALLHELENALTASD